jgi:hypothetical protein
MGEILHVRRGGVQRGVSTGPCPALPRPFARAFGYAPAERILHHGAPPLWSAPVPVTAKLSKQFYDRLGEQVANELVEWFNQVDATYKSDVRELNAANMARIDLRFAELEVRVERALKEQTRFLYVALAAQVLLILGLYTR